MREGVNGSEIDMQTDEINPKRPLGPVKRLLSLDVLRGLAIMGMVFLHNSTFHYGRVNELLALEEQPTFVLIMGFILLWAGIFGFISGLANAFINTKRLNKTYEENDLAAERSKLRKKLIKSAVIGFLFIFIFHWIWTLVTGNSIVKPDPNDPELRTSLIIGLIYYGEFVPIHPEIYIFASSLWMIASNVLIVVPLICFLYKKYGAEEKKNKYLFLLVSSVIIMLITPALRTALFPVMMDLVEQGGGNIALAVPLALLINDPNPIFPYLGYGLYGAAIGMAIANNEKKKTIKRVTAIFGFIWMVIGIFGVMYSGGIVIAGREDIWGQDAVYYSSLSYLLLGLFSFFMLIVFKLFEYTDEETRKRRRKRWNPVIQFGRISLTIFMLEGILAYIVRIAIEAIFPNWNMSLGAMFIFASSMLVLWYLIIRVWSKIDYKGSLEWMFKTLKYKKKSAK